MLIDTHCHIHDRGTYNYALSRQQIGKKFLRDHPDFPHEPADFTPEKIISRAHEADVKKMICIGTSHEDSLAARDFATAHADKGVYWAYGIHPDEALCASESAISNGLSGVTRAGSLEAEPQRGLIGKRVAGPQAPVAIEPIRASMPIAIGEVGLDYRDGESNRMAQMKLFEQMLQLAKDYGLPLIFHIRDAFPDFFAVLNNFPDARGVVHSFSDNADNLKKSLEHGFYIGVNGLATFALELPTEQIPLDRILLETDAPFLTPVPFRGTINEPARIKEICAYVSKLKGESEAKIAEVTTQNAEQLFRI
jgi:TatD DNase family protein